MAETTDPIRAAETFPKFVRAIAQAYGDETAVSLSNDSDQPESLSFADLDRRSALLARGLLARGAGKGSRIGILSGNGPFFAVAFAAVARMGGIAVPLSTTLRANELVRVLRQSDIGGLILQRLFLGADFTERLIDALPDLKTATDQQLRIPAVPYLRWIATEGADVPPGFTPLAAIEGDGEGLDESLLMAAEDEVSPSDQSVEIYTSGSMALPKGVKHLHGPMMARANYLRDMLGPQRGQPSPAALPMFWVGGLMMALLPNLSAGANTVCSERTLRNSRMAMGTVLQEDDIKAMANAKVIWGLGMTETLGPYSHADELRAPGYPLCAPMDHFAPGYEVRVADENDQPVPEGENGEIQVRGFAITPGLHKVPRSAHFTADGYYRTGDMGEFKGKRLLFTGRNGDMIKSASSNVSPAEVEFELQQLAGVESAYVVGLPDHDRGQIVVAAIVADDTAADEAAIIETLRANMSSYKVPRAIIKITRDEVPMLPSNKVARREIAAMIAERLGRT